METHWFEIRDARRESPERFEASAGTPIAELLRSRGYDLAFDCGGRGRCGRCRVRIEGAASDAEASGAREVLACQTRLVASGLRVDATGLARFERCGQAGDASPGGLCAERLAASEASPEERRGGWGVAIDLGTTTLESAFVSLATGRVFRGELRRNGQATYGGDVVSRIASCAQDAANVGRMRRIVAETIEEMIDSGGDALGFESSRVEEIVVSGNATMELILLGEDPSPLGQAPFPVPERAYPPRRWGGEGACAEARLRVFPIFSAFVGGDVLAGYFVLRRLGAFGAWRTVLFLDVGTNGESLLWRDGRLRGTSTAAGPAFEGADVSQGMTARSGAIRRVDWDVASGRWRASTVGDAPAVGVCGSGLVDALAACLDFGLIREDGRIASSEAAPRVSARLGGSGLGRTATISNALEGDGVVKLTQRDVRQAQLAIGAVKTGRRFLLETAGVEAKDLDAVYLAGGFGGALQVGNARRIGLLPGEVADDKVAYLGNASLEGAVGALRGDFDWREVVAAIDDAEIVNLAARKDFAEVFAESTRFPKVL